MSGLCRSNPGALAQAPGPNAAFGGPKPACEMQMGTTTYNPGAQAPQHTKGTLKMSMSKQDFIALADMVRNHNRYTSTPFTSEQMDALAGFCRSQNAAFKRERWIGYIAGSNGPSGGSIKAPKAAKRDTACEGGCGKVRSVICSDSPAQWLCFDCSQARADDRAQRRAESGHAQ